MQPLEFATPAASVELANVPFFGQEDYYCGPSALATVLSRTGIERAPESLVDDVYIPARKGALQIEMVAATRRLERLAVQVEPRLEAILSEIEAGRPVVVLQNLALRWLPVWHYAVVVGYDAERNSFLLRSGNEARRVTALAEFDRSWKRAGRWAIVVLKVGELPASDLPEGYVEAAVGLEATGQLQHAERAYLTGLERWPRNKLLMLGRANTAYALGEHATAIAGYRELLEHHPDYTPAVNNLAHVLDEVRTR